MPDAGRSEKRARPRLPIRRELELDAYAADDVKITASGDDRARITTDSVIVEVRRVGRAFDVAIERHGNRRVTRALPREVVGAVIDAALKCPPRRTDLPPEPTEPD